MHFPAPLHYEETETVEEMAELLLNWATSGDVVVLSVHCDSPYPFINEPLVSCAHEKNGKRSGN